MGSRYLITISTVKKAIKKKTKRAKYFIFLSFIPIKAKGINRRKNGFRTPSKYWCEPSFPSQNIRKGISKIYQRLSPYKRFLICNGGKEDKCMPCPLVNKPLASG